MIIVDANILVYAIDSDSPQHETSRRWLEKALSGTTWIALPYIVVLAFLRLTTRPGIMRHPMPSDDALAYVDSWLKQPYVTLVAPGPNHWPILRNLLLASGTAGNLTSDAHIAAMALEQGATVYSADHDFKRFLGVRHINPLLLPPQPRLPR